MDGLRYGFGLQLMHVSSVNILKKKKKQIIAEQDPSLIQLCSFKYSEAIFFFIQACFFKYLEGNFFFFFLHNLNAEFSQHTG